MKKTIVCFGDSNTHSYCSATGGRFGESERWTGELGLTMHPNDHMHLDAASHYKLAAHLAAVLPAMIPIP